MRSVMIPKTRVSSPVFRLGNGDCDGETGNRLSRRLSGCSTGMVAGINGTSSSEYKVWLFTLISNTIARENSPIRFLGDNVWLFTFGSGMSSREAGGAGGREGARRVGASSSALFSSKRFFSVDVIFSFFSSSALQRTLSIKVYIYNLQFDEVGNKFFARKKDVQPIYTLHVVIFLWEITTWRVYYIKGNENVRN